MGTTLRRLGGRDPEAMARIAAALGMGGVAAADVPSRIADRMDTVFRSLGMPTRLSELGIAREGLPQVLELSLTNFNADSKREFVREKDLLQQVLAAAW
jgi:alcohol dehydrogenase class IV